MQGTCTGDCPPNFPSSDHFQINLEGNQFHHLSKTVFDILPPQTVVQLSVPGQPFFMNNSECCTFGFIETNLNIRTTGGAYCNGVPITIAVNATECNCKQNAHARNQNDCTNLIHYPFFNDTCQFNSTCPTGFREYQTQQYPAVTCSQSAGSSDSSTYTSFGTAAYSLYNTACQRTQTMSPKLLFLFY